MGAAHSNQKKPKYGPTVLSCSKVASQPSQEKSDAKVSLQASTGRQREYDLKMELRQMETKLSKMQIELNETKNVLSDTKLELSKKHLQLAKFETGKVEVAVAKPSIEGNETKFDRCKAHEELQIGKTRSHYRGFYEEPICKCDVSTDLPGFGGLGQKELNAERRRLQCLSFGKTPKTELLRHIRIWLEVQPGSKEDKLELQASLIIEMSRMGRSETEVWYRIVPNEHVIKKLSKENEVLEKMVDELYARSISIMLKKWEEHTEEEVVRQIGVWLENRYGVSGEKKDSIKAYLVGEIDKL